MTECVFCSEVCECMDVYEPAPADAPSYLMAHLDGFRLLSDNAPILPGHLLIVPDEHVPSVALLEPARLQACADLVERVCAGMDEALGAAMVFEHGTGVGCTEQGCCLIHAHLHVLPSRAPVEQWFSDRGTAVLQRTRTVRDLARVGRGAYHYAQRHGEPGWVWDPAGLPSQILRRIIGDDEHVDLWNWRDSLMLLTQQQRVEQVTTNRAAIARVLRAIS